MAQFLIRDVPEATARRWKQKAKLKGRPVEAELRDLIVREGVKPAREEVLRELEKIRGRFKGPVLDVVELIREDRDSR